VRAPRWASFRPPGLALAIVLGAAGCGDAGAWGGVPLDAAPLAPLPDPATPERPPRTSTAELEAWLDQGHHRNLPWLCELGVSPVRLNGSHQRHRICSNGALLDSASGSYPRGAASVKELYTHDDQQRGFAVALKVADGVGAQTWFWYEAIRSSSSSSSGPVVIASGVGVPDCAVCHGAAPRDYIFFRAR
jgi:hypothetical protein